ncbi:hypothetical protein JW756_05995 [Candidatus Woesearchaeota archaeon]|nr:hypothetical protein [Candidatus Woesearchaeota archaeon]
MVASIVSVRMPSSLVQKLKELAKENHFLDVSEEVRSITKSKVMEYKLKLSETAPAKEEKPEKKADFKTENMVKEELIKRLREMIKELEHE